MLIFIDQSTLKNRRWINVDITLTEVMVLFQRWWFAGRKLGLNSSFNISLKTIILLIFINTIRKAPIIGPFIVKLPALVVSLTGFVLEYHEIFKKFFTEYHRSTTIDFSMLFHKWEWNILEPAMAMICDFRSWTKY